MLTEQDKKELIAAVAKECGITISSNDPVFAAVQLHARTMGRGVELMSDRVARHLVAELERGLEKHVDDIGSQVAKRLHEELQSLAEVFHEVEEQVAFQGRLWFGAIAVSGVAILLVVALRTWGVLP